METGLLDAFSVVTLVALIYSVVNFLRNLVNLRQPGATNSVVTQLVVWIAAFVVLLISAQAEVSAEVVVMGKNLGDFDTWSLLLIALAFGSSASVVNDFLASRDTSRTTATPHLIPEDAQVE